MKIKKIIAATVTLSVLLVLVLSTLLVGCTSASQPQEQIKEIRWGTSSVGSNQYIMAAAISELINKYTDYEANVTPTGGTEPTVRALLRKERDFGFANSDTLYDAYNGTGAFEKDGKQPLALVATGHMPLLIFLAQPNIKTIQEFKGKIVMYRRDANPMWGFYGDTVLEAYGFDLEKDIKNVKSVETKELTDGLKTGAVDVGLIPGPVPGTFIPPLLEAKNFNLINVDKNVQDIASKKKPYLIPASVPAGSYKGQDKEVGAIAFAINIFCRPDLPDNVVYDVTKAIFGHLAEFQAAHPDAKEYTLERAVANPIIPMHPGAKKYFKEVGALK